MDKKLLVKLQKLAPTVEPNSKAFSCVISIEPEDSSVVIKKGYLYTIFNVESTVELDTNLTIKIVSDLLQNAYYQSDNISPTQSLEQAILEVKEKLLKLPFDPTKTIQAKMDLNIMSLVLWGNVIYLVKYGTGAAYILKDDGIKEINTVTEGTFSSASGIVSEDNVVILSSAEFAQNYPTEKLLTTSILPQDLTPSSACLILKFILDTTFTPKETIKFEEEKPKDSKKKAIKIRFPSLHKKSVSKIAVPVLALLLILSVAFSIKEKDKKAGPENVEGVATVQTAPKLDDTSNDIQNKVARVDLPPIAELTSANPTNIVASDSTLIVSDPNSGKLYISPIDSPKFTELEIAFPGINSLYYAGGKIYFNDIDGYKIYDLEQKKLLESYLLAGLKATANYLDYVYSIENDKIMKYTKNASALTSNIWAQNADFSGAKSLSIAYSVYVIKQDGTLARYTLGTKDVFEVTGLDKPMNANQIVADNNFKYIYVADSANRRILVLDDKGLLIKQIMPVKSEEWKNIKAIAVSPKEDKLFVLDGSKVYESSL